MEGEQNFCHFVSVISHKCGTYVHKLYFFSNLQSSTTASLFELSSNTTMNKIKLIKIYAI